MKGKLSYQEYNKQISESNYLLFKGDTLSAIELIENTIKSIKRPYIRDYRNLIVLKLKKGEDIDNLANQAFKLGASKKYLCTKFEIKNKCESNWENLYPEYQKHRKQFLESIDTNYRAQVEKLYIEDQRYRSQAPQNTNLNIDSLRQVNDQLVLNKLRELIAQKGFFGFSKIGEDLQFNGWLIQEIFFRHSAPKINKNEFHKLLYKAVLNGDIYPETYAGIIDYDCIKQDQFEQVFGTSFFRFRGKYCFPLKNKENIDSLRISLGMLDFKRHLECFNAKYDEKIKPWER